MRLLEHWAQHTRPRLGLYADMYLVASLAYYHHEISPVTDAEFDRICRWLLENFELVKAKAWNADLFELDSLRAGTGFSIDVAKYPQRIREAVDELRKEEGPP